MEKLEYVLIVDSPELGDAHKELLKVVQSVSEGDFINLFTRQGEKRATGRTTSALRPDQIHIPAATLDRHVLLELGAAAWFEGYTRARAWFDEHRRPQFPGRAG